MFTKAEVVCNGVGLTNLTCVVGRSEAMTESRRAIFRLDPQTGDAMYSAIR